MASLVSLLVSRQPPLASGSRNKRKGRICKFQFGTIIRFEHASEFLDVATEDIARLGDSTILGNIYPCEIISTLVLAWSMCVFRYP